MAKRLFLIHGRDFKPEQDDLNHIWTTALRHGLERDHDSSVVAAFDALAPSVEFIYYGDLSNAFLRRRGRHFDAETDARSREVTLGALREWGRGDFIGAQGEVNYQSLDGKLSFKEFLADAIANPFHFLGASESLISLVAPDMAHYWDEDRAFGSDVRWRLTEPLARALGDGDDVMLIAHSLGSIVSYDVLWKFSYYGEWQHVRNQGISEFITLGCPLGNTTVQGNLKGGRSRGLRRFPVNIRQWHNFAAEDDFVSQDETVADDFAEMEAAGMVGSINDHRIYNLSLRRGESNPHHSAGYLMHPEVAARVASWLTA
jgi:hypothetical protein